jgi:hypothetical protein
LCHFLAIVSKSKHDQLCIILTYVQSTQLERGSNILSRKDSSEQGVDILESSAKRETVFAKLAHRVRRSRFYPELSNPHVAVL